MKNAFQLFVILFFNVYIEAQNNLIIFSEGTEPFHIVWKDKKIPDIAQTDIKLTQIYDNPVTIKILFNRPTLKPIDTTLYLYHPSKPIQHQDVIYYIPKNNQKLQYLATLPSSDLKPIIPEIDTTIQVKTREEKTLQKIIFLNDSGIVCLKAIDTSDFQKVLKHLKSTPNVDRKVVLMEQFIKHNCLHPNQAQMLLEEVPFEVERLKIAHQLLPKLINVFDIEKWKLLFKNTIAQQTFIEQYQNHLKNLANNPMMEDSLFQSIYSQLKTLSNDYEKLETLKIIFSHYSIDIKTLSLLVNTLQHDQYKEEALKKSYYSLKNKKDFEKTFQWLYFKESNERLKQFYEKQN